MSYFYTAGTCSNCGGRVGGYDEKYPRELACQDCSALAIGPYGPVIATLAAPKLHGNVFVRVLRCFQ